MPKKYKIICKNCGKHNEGQNKIFCGRKCYSEFKLGLREKITCEICGKSFTGKQRFPRRVYCSKKCFSLGLSKRYTKKNHTSCKQCGKGFDYTPSAKMIFCSIKCRAEYYTGKHLKEGVNTIVRCKFCDKEITIRTTRLKRVYKNGIFCSKQCSGKYRKGILNPAWLGGSSFYPYPLIFNKELKSKIRERDNYKCLLCGVPEIEICKKLDIHHIDYNKNNCEESNLISLCYKCHLKTNRNRTYWKKYFLQKMEELWVGQKP